MNFDYNKQLKISLGGTKDAVRKAAEALEKLTFTKNEGKDRLLIQRAMDDNNLRASVLYDGNFVWPYKRLLKEYQRKNAKAAQIDGEDDWLDSVDPAALREELARRGIVNGEIVDEKAFSENSFASQVMRDVAAISRQEAEKSRFEQLSLFDRTA